MIPRQPSSAGFSLVEVVFALAVATFCLFILAQFLSVGLTSIQTSTEETNMANLATQVAADLRATPASSTTSPYYGISVPAAGGASTLSNPTTLYMLADGSAGSSVTKANANYRVSVGVAPPTSGPSATVVRIQITWPPQQANTANQWPTQFSGSYETMLSLNRN